MKKKVLKFALFQIIFGGLVVFFSGCTSEDRISDATLQKNSAEMSAAGFTFENSINMSLDLVFKDLSGNPVSGVFLKIYTQNPYLKGSYLLDKSIVPNFKGGTDEAGKYSTVVPVPGHLDSVYIVIENPLYPRKIVVKKSKTYSQTIFPVDYNLARSAKLRAESSLIPVTYTRTSTPNPGTLTPAISNPGSSNYWVLGSYNATTGYPSYITGVDVVPSGLLTRILTTLPYFINVNQSPLQHINHPEYFSNSDLANIYLAEAGNIWVTFLAEGAGLNNTFGYFYYPEGSAPASISAIDKRIVVFPRSSNAAMSGGLASGTKVKLMYQDPTDGTWGDLFPAGTTIGWFLVTSGWGGTTDEGTYDNLFANKVKHQYSMKALNAGGKPQSVILYDKTSSSLVLGFEDIAIGDGISPASDGNFNDILFYVNWNPPTSVDPAPYPKLIDTNDDDNDGVNNTNDDYPNDYSRAYDNYSQGANVFGSFGFEDSWPVKGDYDFNDLVMDYQIKYVTNALNRVVDVILNTRTRAVGALYNNGFAWELNSSPSDVQSITTTYSGGATLLAGSLFPLNAKGYESGTSKLVIPFFDFASTLFGGQTGYINTVLNSTVYDPVVIVKKITYNNSGTVTGPTPVNTSQLSTSGVTLASLGTVPFNPFIIVDGDRTKEIHKANLSPTNKASLSYFGTYDDKSNLSTTWYVGLSKYPWVIDTPVVFDYPIEGEDIQNSFLKFSEWVVNSGTVSTDWYSNKAAGYRNNQKIFVKN